MESSCYYIINNKNYYTIFFSYQVPLSLFLIFGSSVPYFIIVAIPSLGTLDTLAFTTVESKNNKQDTMANIERKCMTSNVKIYIYI